MKSSHPGPPPSRRGGHGVDWRDRLRSATHGLVIGLRKSMELDDSATRKHIIRSVRMAINEVADPDIERSLDFTSSAAKECDEEGLVVTAGIFRAIMLRQSINRNDPRKVESFMAEVVAVLDEELGLAWRAKVRKATGMLLTGLIKTRNGQRQLVRRLILDAAREALSDRPMDQMVKRVELPASSSSRPGPSRWSATRASSG